MSISDSCPKKPDIRDKPFYQSMNLSLFPNDCSKPVKVLSFDYGTTKIGVAFGQSISSTTKAVTIIKAKDGIPNWEAVEHLIESWTPDFLIVGLPYNLDGTESKFLQRAVKFGNRLYGRFNLPTFGVDECLSSESATQKLLGEGNRKLTGTKIDDVAAQIILETWFSSYKTRGAPKN